MSLLLLRRSLHPRPRSSIAKAAAAASFSTYPQPLLRGRDWAKSQRERTKYLNKVHREPEEETPAEAAAEAEEEEETVKWVPRAAGYAHARDGGYGNRSERAPGPARGRDGYSERRPGREFPSQGREYPSQGREYPSQGRGNDSERRPGREYPSQGRGYPSQGQDNYSERRPGREYPSEGRDNYSERRPNREYPSQGREYPSQGQGNYSERRPGREYPSQRQDNYSERRPSREYPSQGRDYPSQGRDNYSERRPGREYPSQGGEYPSQGRGNDSERRPNREYPSQGQDNYSERRPSREYPSQGRDNYSERRPNREYPSQGRGNDSERRPSREYGSQGQDNRYQPNLDHEPRERRESQENYTERRDYRPSRDYSSQPQANSPATSTSYSVRRTQQDYSLQSWGSQSDSASPDSSSQDATTTYGRPQPSPSQPLYDSRPVYERELLPPGKSSSNSAPRPPPSTRYFTAPRKGKHVRPATPISVLRADNSVYVVHAQAASSSDHTNGSVGIGIWFGPGSPLNMCRALSPPEVDLSTANDVGAWKSTNHRAEIIAVAEALRILRQEVPPASSLIVACEDAFVFRALTDWVYLWRKNGWQPVMGSGEEPRINRDVIEAADNEIRSLERAGYRVRIWAQPKGKNPACGDLAKSAIGKGKKKKDKKDKSVKVEEEGEEEEEAQEEEQLRK
ncbi:hypothetical protein FN846DRAFT_1610 [Sphaerosporella brunnea]|uniref:RNase H type-1 domain-containing protein n=1 Tax=Sphaerosporella brunnea TaxID=1250544 RepID=A0A5J5FCA5_9PEZI|nr:hypothetical protein FN846DRAFT_1610 [Sphaerosporella brunnea]